MVFGARTMGARRPRFAICQALLKLFVDETVSGSLRPTGLNPSTIYNPPSTTLNPHISTTTNQRGTHHGKRIQRTLLVRRLGQRGSPDLRRRRRRRRR
ncbi:MAG: hypothetical protein BRD52_00635, partial [Bacteroidetes bacterium SW_4_67_19]